MSEGRAAASRVVVASAPGRLLLAGEAPGPRLSVALDRRALCRVETGGSGVRVEAKDALTRLAAADVAELVARAPGSVVARALELSGARGGIAVVTEWKLPAGSGVDGDGALALAATAALARATGADPGKGELLRRAREAAERAGRPADDAVHSALSGGVVLTKGGGGSLAATPLEVDPGRVEEALLLVDAGEPGSSPRAAPHAPHAEAVASALAEGRSEEIVALLATDDGQERVAGLVGAAGGAAWRLPGGRLMAIWAPPGARGPGRGEAVREALKAAGLKPLAIRVDLRGLELD